MKKLLIFLIFLLLHSSIFCYEITKDSWVVEWGVLEGINLSHSNQLLLSSIPTYLSENIQAEHNHYLSKEESIDLFKSLVNEELNKLKLERLTLIKNRDELLFSDSGNDKYDELSIDINEVSEKIIELDNIDIDSQEVISVVPIEYKLLDLSLDLMNEQQIRHYLNRDGVDYFIHGIMEQVDDSLFLTISLDSKYIDSSITVWSGVGSNEDITDYREDILLELSKIIISPKLLELEISVLPTDSLIYINDDFRSLGYYKGSFIEGEELDISISKEGFVKTDLSKLLTGNESIEIELTPIESKSVSITSIPSGASLYYGSKYIGKTPMEIPIYSYSQKLTLEMEGHMDQSIIIDSNSIDAEVVLSENIFDRDENLITQKNKFYISSAIFSFALALPLYFSAQNANIEYNDQVGISNEIAVISIGNAAIWGLNFFYRLYKYLSAAEISVE